MTDIPDEIMAKAREVVKEREKHPEWYLTKTMVDLIAAALQSERTASEAAAFRAGFGAGESHGVFGDDSEDAALMRFLAKTGGA